jgi:hypothetical protein
MDADLRAKIRALMDSGILPRDLPRMEKLAPAHGARPTQVLIGEQPQERCTACEEPGPQVSYTYAGGSVIVRLHAACDALWQQERLA